MHSLQISATRLWDTLLETAKFGGTSNGGITRLALTDEDRAVREWFKATAKAIGCTVKVDEVGYSNRDVISGAGHVAVYIARVAPTAMIFVPCLNGISHSEAESATIEECAAGGPRFCSMRFSNSIAA